MSTFDLVINLIEACTYVGFIYFVLHKNKKILLLSIFILIYFTNTTLHNYYLLPELSLTLTSCIILFLYAHLLNSNAFLQNIFLALFIDVVSNISMTLILLISKAFNTSPFNPGYFSIFVTILYKSICIIIFIFSYIFLKKIEFSKIKTKKFIFIFICLLIINFIFSTCIELIFYYHIFNTYIMTILILINLLTLFLCYIFLETQKEQKLLLKLQSDQLKRENQLKINLINQKNVSHLNLWKHDMTYIFSFLKKYIENQKYEEALKTISIYTDVLNNYNLLINTNNDILNSVLIEYNDAFIKNNIHFYINSKQTDIPLSEEDYRFILEILFKEAIENCENEKGIWISSLQKDSYFYLSFEFSCLENTHLSLFEQLSSLLNKYNGMMKEGCEYDKYKVTLLIPL